MSQTNMSVEASTNPRNIGRRDERDETFAAENNGTLRQLLIPGTLETNTKSEPMKAASGNDGKPGAMFHTRKPVEVKPSTQQELLEANALIEAKIRSKKVMVFSKSFCPSCKKAKNIFLQHMNNGDLNENDYEVIEIQGRDDMNAVQNQLKLITGVRSVPRVFINGKCIGGGDETFAAENNGTLRQLLISGTVETDTKREPMNAAPGNNGKPGAMFHARKPVEVKPSTQEELREANSLIEAKISSKKVMVFSKSFCPSCKKAKNIFLQYMNKGDLNENDYEVMEIQGRDDMNAVQNQLKLITGVRSVPRVFINGKCIGGGDETFAAENNGTLRQLLIPGTVETDTKREPMKAAPGNNGKPGTMFHARKPVEVKPSTQKELHEANSLIEAKISSKKVMIFSKSFCPSCKKAKNIFLQYMNNGDLNENDYEVMEIQGRDDMNAIQNQLKLITGVRSVPRVFINGKCIGGGDETFAAENNGTLRQLLIPGTVETETKRELMKAASGNDGKPGAMFHARKPVEVKPSTKEELLEANALIEAKISSKKVMIFSKSFCPSCKKAKHIFLQYMNNGDLKGEDYEVMEIQGRDDMNAIQNQLKLITGARSVPRVFIDGQCIGGGDETLAAENSGKLQQLLSEKLN